MNNLVTILKSCGIVIKEFKCENSFKREVNAYFTLSKISENLKFKLPKILNVINKYLIIVLEYIPGKKPRTLDDLIKCIDAINSLHSLGFIHGDFSPHECSFYGDYLYIFDWENFHRGKNRWKDYADFIINTFLQYPKRIAVDIFYIIKNEYLCNDDIKLFKEYVKKITWGLLRKKIPKGRLGLLMKIINQI